MTKKVKSDGSTASYYELPEGATELQHLISHRNMNSQIGEIFRACYRFGLVEHSDMLRDAKKIMFYAQAEIERLVKLEGKQDPVAPTPSTQEPIESTVIWPDDERIETIGQNGNEGEHYKQANKPSWDDAPEWAGYLAQDEIGNWWAYQFLPKHDDSYWVKSSRDGRVKFLKKASQNQNWRNTLEPRPTKEPIEMTYIGLTHDDLTPDDQINPMDCEAVRDIVDEWVFQLTVNKTDAKLPDGKVVVAFDSFLDHFSASLGFAEIEVRQQMITFDGLSIYAFFNARARIHCESKADLAVSYFKSLNDKERD